MKVQRTIESFSLFVLIGLVALRPLIGESYDPAGNTLTEALGVVSDPKPLTTLVFDALILGAACGWLVTRALGSPLRYRRTGLEWGAALVAVAAIVSCFFAGNKRLAINATIDWLCLPLLAIALVQLCRERWQRRLLLAAILASACVQAAQCLGQYLSFNETWAHYQSIKADFWARQGVELDSSKVELFEQRMRAREATGFFPHSNVAGSYLVLCFFAGLGFIAWTWRSLKERGNILSGFLCTIGTMLMLVGIVLTKSLGALLSAMAGLALWIVARRYTSWIDAHRARTWMIAWLCVAAGTGAVIGYGLYRGSLPGWSLTFRWQYWQASSKLIADHWTTGVGRENFGRHYLGYKSIESPEEVANPHNFFVQAAADWGLIGLVGILVMALHASYRLVTLPPARSPPVEGSSSSKTLVWTVALLFVVTLGRLPLLGTLEPNFLYYSTVTTGVIWLTGFIVFMGTMGARAEALGSDTGKAVAVGLLAFLVHDMINFAMFIPGSATTFFAMLGYCLAERSDEPVEPEFNVAASFTRKWLPAGAGFGALVFVVWIGVYPVSRASSWLLAAKKFSNEPLTTAIQGHSASLCFDSASASDPYDSTPETARVRWLIGLAGTQTGEKSIFQRKAFEALTAAMRRDPFNASIPRMRSNLYLNLAQSTGNDDDYLSAVEDARRALELYPLDPAGMVMLADVQAAAGEATKSEVLLREALTDYDQAIQLDDRRLSWETLHRMREREKEEILAKMRRLRELLGEREE